MIALLNFRTVTRSHSLDVSPSWPVSGFGPCFPGEDEALAGRLGHGVVERPPVGQEVFHRHYPLTVADFAVGVLAVTVARVVALLQFGQRCAGCFPGLFLIVSLFQDDNDVQVRLFVPAAGVPGASEDGRLDGGVFHQNLAERRGPFVGLRVDQPGHLFACPVAFDERHGAPPFPEHASGLGGG